jgi:hypothetical protein
MPAQTSCSWPGPTLLLKRATVCALAGDHEYCNCCDYRTRPPIVSDVTTTLYLPILASGADGPPDALDWEVLTAADTELTVLVPTEIALTGEARMFISSAVADALAGDAFPPRPGEIYRNCPVARWCPSSTM